MDKTLDMLAWLHRLIFGVALALAVVGLSIHRPSGIYAAAEDEISTLQTGISAVSEQVDDVFKRIYAHSELEQSTTDWLALHGAAQKSVPIEVDLTGDLSIPDAEVDPLVTLDSQVKWADRIYLKDDDPFYLCTVQRPQVFSALDRLFASSPPPEIQQITVFLRRDRPGVDASIHCDLELTYSAQVGTSSGTRSVMLDVPSNPMSINELAPPGPGWVDLDLADTLKGSGLGDFEDGMSAHLPVLQQFWNEIGNRPPGAALSYFETMKDQDQEKSKEKIDILGESLSGSLTIVLTCLALLCLLIYLAVLLQQVRTQLPGHSQAVAASQFFGIMSSLAGRVVMCVLLLFPLGVVADSLFRVFPPFASEWPGPSWQVSISSRWLLTSLLAAVTALVLAEIWRILAALRLQPAAQPAAASPDSPTQPLPPASPERLARPALQNQKQEP